MEHGAFRGLEAATAAGSVPFGRESRQPQPAIAIYTLGREVVEHRGERLGVNGAREFALLVYLASRPGIPIVRETLAEFLWDSGTTSQRLHSLSQAVYKLKAVLPVGVLQVERGSLAVRSGSIWLDAAELRESVRAGQCHRVEELWLGDFLSSRAPNVSGAFATWADTLRSELRGSATAGLRSLLQAAEAGGDQAGFQRILQRLLAEYPEDADLHKKHMRLLLARGERIEARQLHVAFGRRIGVRRSSGWREYASLLEEIESAGESGLVVPSDENIRPRFVGRREELQRLSREFDRACKGEARFVLVRGRAGMGKTRICEQFLRSCAIKGARVLSGSCHPSSEQLPLTPFINAFSHLTPRDTVGIGDEPLTYVRPLLPARALRLTGRAKDPEDPQVARHRLFEGLCTVLDTLARRAPVVLFLDDMHWADEFSAAALEAMRERLVESPLLVLVAARPEDVRAESAVARGLDRLGAWQVVRLHELDREAVNDLISWREATTGRPIPADIRELVVNSADGHPFFTLELLCRTGALGEASMGAPGGPTSVPIPRTVEAFLEERFRRLSSAARDVTDALAILGTMTAHHLVQRVLGAPEDAYVAAVEELAAAGLVLDEGSRLAFRHDLVREAAYRSLGGARRRWLHGRAARVLLDEREVNPGILAAHLDATGNRTNAFRYAIAAASSAERIRALAEREFFLRMALRNAVTRGAELLALEQLGDCLYDLRREMEAEEMYSVAHKRIGASVGSSRYLRIEVRRLAIAASRQPRSEEFVTRMHVAVAALRRLNHREQAAALVRFLIPAIWNAGLAHLILDDISVWLDAASHLPISVVRVDLLSRIAQLLALSGEPSDGLRIANDTVADAYRLQDPVALLCAFEARAVVCFVLGKIERAEADYEAAFDMANSSDIRRFRTVMLNNWGVLRYETGDFVGARQLLEKAREYAAADREWSSYTMVEGNLAAAAYLSGDTEMAWRHVHEVERLMEFANWYIRANTLGIKGLLALASGPSPESKVIYEALRELPAGPRACGADLSFAELFLARVLESEGRKDLALQEIDSRSAEYENGDVIARSRLQLEKARLLLSDHPQEALRIARDVRQRATEMHARPLLDNAELLVRRAKASTTSPTSRTSQSKM